MKNPLVIGADLSTRRIQRRFLQAYYKSEYLPALHDAFVMKYNQEVEKENMAEYMANRNI